MSGSRRGGNPRRGLRFQGFRGFHQSENFDVDLFWVQPVVPNPGRLDSVDNNQNFAGAWATYKPKKGTTADLTGRVEVKTIKTVAGSCL